MRWTGDRRSRSVRLPDKTLTRWPKFRTKRSQIQQCIRVAELEHAEKLAGGKVPGGDVR